MSTALFAVMYVRVSVQSNPADGLNKTFISQSNGDKKKSMQISDGRSAIQVLRPVRAGACLPGGGRSVDTVKQLDRTCTRAGMTSSVLKVWRPTSTASPQTGATKSKVRSY